MPSHSLQYLGIASLLFLGSLVGPPVLQRWQVANLPGPVLETAQEQFPGGVIDAVENSTHLGAPVYNLRIEHHGVPCVLRVTPGGRVLRVERPTRLSQDSHLR